MNKNRLNPAHPANGGFLPLNDIKDFKDLIQIFKLVFVNEKALANDEQL